MQCERIGQRGYLFTFDDLKQAHYDCSTSVYVINGANRYVFCDSYLGEKYIELMAKYLFAKCGKKEGVVFNSHYHWDHIWGNSAFKETLIISHTLTRDLIKLYGHLEYEKNKAEFASEKVEIVLPNLTFTERLTFQDDGVEFFFSPGHTGDSSSCIDLVDKILFVGDNLESPYPYHDDETGNWHSFCQTLLLYKEMVDMYDCTLVSSHTGVVSREWLDNNILYVEGKCRDV